LSNEEFFIRPLILEDETNTQSQNTGQLTPSNGRQYAEAMEFSVENNIKEHFYFITKLVQLTLLSQ
jgi:hypothetical protein